MAQHALCMNRLQIHPQQKGVVQVWQMGGPGDEASSKGIDAAALMQHYGRGFAGMPLPCHVYAAACCVGSCSTGKLRIHAALQQRSMQQ